MQPVVIDASQGRPGNAFADEKWAGQGTRPRASGGTSFPYTASNERPERDARQLWADIVPNGSLHGCGSRCPWRPHETRPPGYSGFHVPGTGEL